MKFEVEAGIQCSKIRMRLISIVFLFRIIRLDSCVCVSVFVKFIPCTESTSRNNKRFAYTFTTSVNKSIVIFSRRLFDDEKRSKLKVSWCWISNCEPWNNVYWPNFGIASQHVHETRNETWTQKLSRKFPIYLHPNVRMILVFFFIPRLVRASPNSPFSSSLVWSEYDKRARHHASAEKTLCRWPEH